MFQVIKMLLTIITIFFLCWGPKLIHEVLKGFHLEQLHTPTAFNIMVGCDQYHSIGILLVRSCHGRCSWHLMWQFRVLQLALNLLPYLQSAVNPVIYGFMSRNFRRSMRVALERHCRTCCRRGSPKNHCTGQAIPLQSTAYSTHVTHMQRSNSNCWD